MWARNSFANTPCQVGEEGTSHMDAISPHINSKIFRIKDSLLIVSGTEQFDASSFSLTSRHYAFYFHYISFSSLDLVAVQACEVELELYYLECPFFFLDLVTVHQSPQATQLLFQVSSSLGYPSSSFENNHSFLEFLLYLFFVDWQSVFWIKFKQYLGCPTFSSNKGKNKVKCVDMNTTLLWLYASVYEVYVQVYSNKWRCMDKKKKMMLKKLVIDSIKM